MVAMTVTLKSNTAADSTDGYATNAITLSTDYPFVLMKSNTHLCQKVKGMVEKEKMTSRRGEE